MKQKVKRFKYLKGNFSGKYRGEVSDTAFTSGSSYRFEFYDCEISNCRVLISEDEVKPEAENIIEKNIIRDAHIELVDERGNKSYYKDDLENVQLFNYQFHDVVKDGKETYGTVRGEIFAGLGYIEEVEVGDQRVKVLPVPRDPYAGCANAVSIIIFAILGFALLSLIKIRGAALALFIIGGVCFLLYRLSRTNLSGKFATRIIGIFFGALLFFGIVFAVAGRHHSYVPTWAESQDEKNYDYTNENSIDSSTVTHSLTWYNYDWSKRFSGYFKVNGTDYRKARDKRESLDLPLADAAEWQTLYTSLYSVDRFRMDSIYKMFEDIGKSKRLNRRQFLDMVVTCVQHIVYSKVIEGDCASDQEYLQHKLYSWEDSIGCLGYCKFGIQSPNEFAYNLLGDCDTRTVFLYTVLTHFKYDVLIFCSLEYEHSVLGINIPAFGTYKTVNNKKYFLWETTYPDWTVGNVSPEMTDTYFWHVFMPSAKDQNQKS